MSDISVFGLRVVLKASRTYPIGIVLTEWADDTDPFDVPSTQIAGKGMGINGHLVTWTVATPTDVNLAVIPNSRNDLELQRLALNNRAIIGKTPSRDIITMTVNYPDGRVVNFLNGKLTDAVIAQSSTSTGRMKSKPYAFTFESMSSN